MSRKDIFDAIQVHYGKELEPRFEQMDDRFKQIDHRYDQVDGWIDGIEKIGRA